MTGQKEGGERRGGKGRGRREFVFVVVWLCLLFCLLACFAVACLSFVVWLLAALLCCYVSWLGLVAVRDVILRCWPAVAANGRARHVSGHASSLI